MSQETNQDKKWYGYTGKILRVNLTDSTTEIFSSEKYLPENIGGKALCNAIFWDEVGPGVGAFDPENKMILASGPTTGTGIPTGGRTTMASIAPNSLPEQYATGSMGGKLGTYLKYAGYDALIVEGCAKEHTYLLIEDEKVSFCRADLIWGMNVHNTQNAITLAHGPDVCSMVIGPAGEHLVRIATVTTSNDHALSKSGFGAVFGSKNLKAIAIKGSGEVIPGDIQKVLELRKEIGEPHQVVNVIEPQKAIGRNQNQAVADWNLCRFACSPGCTARCQRVMMGTQPSISGEKVDQLEKCVSVRFFGTNYDSDFPVWLFVSTKANYRTMAINKSWKKPIDPNDPDSDVLDGEKLPGDYIGFYGPNFDRGLVMNQLCNEYGLDKWDIGVWYFGWLGMAGQEGLLDDLDFGMKVDLDDVNFVRHFLTCLTYRVGIGDLFAEGMARAIRALGKEKYGDAIYHGRHSANGEAREIPVSVETSWGQSSHWSGRGSQGTPKWLWLINSLMFMVNTRDPIASGHIHLRPEQLKRLYKEGVSESRSLIEYEIRNERDSIIKDSITACEWQSPNPFWTGQEAKMYSAAVGREVTEEELYEMAERSRLMFRAILIRNYDRDREKEVASIYPNMTYPDPNGETASWDEWNDVVDRYYTASGWDLETGWPTRSTWEKHGLKDIADELEAIGKLPPEGRTEYIRKPNPIGR